MLQQEPHVNQLATLALELILNIPFKSGHQK